MSARLRLNPRAVRWYARATWRSVVLAAVLVTFAALREPSFVPASALLLLFVVMDKHDQRKDHERTWMSGYYAAIEHRRMVGSGRLPNRYSINPPEPWEDEPRLGRAHDDAAPAPRDAGAADAGLVLIVLGVLGAVLLGAVVVAVAAGVIG